MNNVSSIKERKLSNMLTKEENKARTIYGFILGIIIGTIIIVISKIMEKYETYSINIINEDEDYEMVKEKEEKTKRHNIMMIILLYIIEILLSHISCTIVIKLLYKKYPRIKEVVEELGI